MALPRTGDGTTEPWHGTEEVSKMIAIVAELLSMGHIIHSFFICIRDTAVPVPIHPSMYRTILLLFGGKGYEALPSARSIEIDAPLRAAPPGYRFYYIASCPLHRLNQALSYVVWWPTNRTKRKKGNTAAMREKLEFENLLLR
ncbi:hypothetical protein Adt_29106 [Abeliophyllum distichum]|uniref:Uncharacterized protein n=1 Tax=Abeliophyllum distichum TaxID=126358 RepID=A0ABD1S0K5_9LAMI